jgi:hypothetical protein
MTVRPFQSAWRFSRNELSRKRGSLSVTFDGLTPDQAFALADALAALAQQRRT